LVYWCRWRCCRGGRRIFWYSVTFWPSRPVLFV
jgi:hypothetical protein